MPVKTKIRAAEKSTYAVDMEFEDEDGNAVAPKSLLWTLTDRNGTPINGREREAVAAPAASVTVVLKDDDLQILAAERALEYVERRFVIEATYDSSNGTDLPLNDVLTFTLDNLAYVS